MQWKLISESHPKTYAVIMEAGDEAMSVLTQFAQSRQLSACQFTAIGAFSEAELGYFDYAVKDYRKIPVSEQVEVLSLTGDVTLLGKDPQVHAHVVLGRSDGSTRGGHLLTGLVRPTLEVILTESPAYLKRVHDPASGLALIRI